MIEIPNKFKITILPYSEKLRVLHQGSTVVDALRRRCPISTGHEPKLMEAFSHTKASLVLTVCEKGAPSSTSMILDRSMHLGIPKPFYVEVVRGRCPQQHKA